MAWFLAPLLIAMAVCEACAFANHSKRQLRGGDVMQTQKPSCPAGYVDKTYGHAYWWDCAKRCPGPWPWADRNCGCACVRPDELRAMEEQRAIEQARVYSRGPARGSGTTPGPNAATGDPGSIASGTYITSEAAASAVAAAAGQSGGASRAGGGAGGVGSGGTGSSSAASSSSSQAVSLGAGPAAPSGSAPVALGYAGQAQAAAGQAAPVPDETTIPSQNFQSATSTASPAATVAEPALSDVAVAMISVSFTMFLGSCLLATVVYIKVRNAPKNLPVEEQQLAVRLMMRCISQVNWWTPTETPVEPIKQETVDTVAVPQADPIAEVIEACKVLAHPVQFSRPPVQHFRMEQVQPNTNQIAPDVSFVARQQRERVMNGGWLSADGMNAPRKPTPRPSPTSSVPGSARSSRRPSKPGSVPGSARSSRKPTPRPSVNSDASTCSPSKPPSIASTGSKPPTPPRLD